jgi:hypothetical protein
LRQVRILAKKRSKRGDFPRKRGVSRTQFEATFVDDKRVKCTLHHLHCTIFLFGPVLGSRGPGSLGSGCCGFGFGGGFLLSFGLFLGGLFLRGWFESRRLVADGADGDFCNRDEASCVAGANGVNDQSVADAGDEVADVLVAGERRHGALVGLVGRFPGGVIAFAFVNIGQFLVVDALPCAVAALDSLVMKWIGLCAHDSIVRRNGILIGKVGRRICGVDSTSCGERFAGRDLT